MKISRHLHRRTAVKKMLSTLALLLILAALAGLSARYSVQFDITSNDRNSLSSVSQNVLNSLDGAVEIKAYIKKDPALRAQISQLIARYQKHKTDFTLTFIDPDTQPDKVRELAIPTTGALFVEYQKRSQRIGYLDESTLTQALLQLASADEHWITFLSGHGERSPDGHANFDLSRFSEELAQRNIRTQILNLAEMPAIPDNSALLVIAGPHAALLPGEMTLITDYIRQGGSLLWLTDPDNPPLPELEQILGIKKLPGTVLDASAGLYGINDPRFILVSRYSSHPVTQKFNTLTLYPIASAWSQLEENTFNSEALLKSSVKSWTETGTINGETRFDADSDEHDGPLTLAYALSRKHNNDSQQRIIVIGDGDFLANSYLDNVGNLDLGIRLINWLIDDERAIVIPSKNAQDKNLELSSLSVAIIGFSFLIIIPLMLITAGLMIWRKSKK
ncbi:MAG: ABC transporter, partial [Gammaproteobacteria bacterium HGW-Gammaproteobacteria-10]